MLSKVTVVQESKLININLKWKNDYFYHLYILLFYISNCLYCITPLFCLLDVITHKHCF
jgi:hypothetical protein